MEKNRIEVNELQSYIDDGWEIIDIREKSELMALPKLKVSKHIPMSGIIYNSTHVLPNKDEKLIIVCNGGNRSNVIRKKMTNEGYTNVLDVIGGMTAIKESDSYELDK